MRRWSDLRPGDIVIWGSRQEDLVVKTQVVARFHAVTLMCLQTGMLFTRHRLATDEIPCEEVIRAVD